MEQLLAALQDLDPYSALLTECRMNREYVRFQDGFHLFLRRDAFELAAEGLAVIEMADEIREGALVLTLTPRGRKASPFGEDL